MGRALVILGCALAIGCGSESPFDLVQIRGKVTYEDGSPVTAGQLRFISLAPPVGTAHPRPAVAAINSDGTFDVVTSLKHGDGLVPGRHKVAFIFATDSQGNSLVPPEYESGAKTPLEIDTADSPLEIKVPRP